MVKNRLPPDKADQVVAVPHRIGREVGKSALVVHPSTNDQLVLNEVVQSVHNGSGAGNIQLTFDAVDLSFDRHSVGDQAVKDLLQLGHGICAAVGGKLSLINEEMYLEHLSSASDEFGVQALLGPLEDKVLETISNDKLQANVLKLNQLGLDEMISEHLEMRKQQRIDDGGMSLDMLRSFFNGFAELEQLIELFEHGTKWLHKQVFECNGLMYGGGRNC